LIHPTFLPWIFLYWIATSVWIDWIQSHVMYPNKDPNVFTIVAHMHQDDISPCHMHKLHYYLANQYYLEMIDQYMPSLAAAGQLKKNRCVEVIIHALAKEEFVTKVETMDVFCECNFTLKLDTTPFLEVWGDMMMAMYPSCPVASFWLTWNHCVSQICLLSQITVVASGGSRGIVSRPSGCANPPTQMPKSLCLH